MEKQFTMTTSLLRFYDDTLLIEEKASTQTICASTKEYRTCVECSNSFIAKGVRIRCDACHDERKNEVQKKKDLVQNGKRGWDYIVCPVCDEHFGEITLSHAKKHGFSSLIEFKKAHNLNSIKCGSARERMIGSNNPGYQHGGKFSPFSKKFVSYEGMDETIIAEKLKKDAKQRIAEMTANGNNSTTIEFYQKRGMKEEEAQNALAKRQSTFSLGICVEKHGEIEGTEIWLARQEKWLNSFKKQNYSKISQELFDEIMSTGSMDGSSVYYATYDREDKKSFKNKEYRLKLSKSWINPDFILVDKKKIIEFDGDYWHSERVANPGSSAERDRRIIEAGYSVLHIKECEFRSNRQKVIQECLNYLTT
jgi:hypothetical protein